MRFMSSGASPRWKHVQSCSLSAALGSGTELSDRFSEVEGWGGVGRVSGTQKFTREDFFSPTRLFFPVAVQARCVIIYFFVVALKC